MVLWYDVIIVTPEIHYYCDTVVLQPSLTGHSRVVTHDVPVGVVPRRLWNDFAEPEMPDFDVCKTLHHY